MMIGQDERTFHQYNFSGKSWEDHANDSQIVPKSVGEILMISGFQEREFYSDLRDLMTNKMLIENQLLEVRTYISICY